MRTGVELKEQLNREVLLIWNEFKCIWLDSEPLNL